MPSTDSAILNRREASLKLLRLKGVAAGTADLGFWLSEHSQHPEPELAINLKLSRRSLSRAHPERPTGGNLDDLLLKKDARGRNRSGGARRLCGEGLLEFGSFLAALFENGVPARPGNLRVREDPHTRKKQWTRKEGGAL